MSTRKGIGTVASNIKGLVAVCHRVTFGASSAVSSQSSGTGVTFAANATGVFDVTLSDKWDDLVGISATQMGGSLGGGTWEVSTDLSSGDSFSVTHLAQDGTPAAGDPPTSAFNFVIWMRNTASGPTL